MVYCKSWVLIGLEAMVYDTLILYTINMVCVGVFNTMFVADFEVFL